MSTAPSGPPPGPPSGPPSGSPPAGASPSGPAAASARGGGPSRNQWIAIGAVVLLLLGGGLGVALAGGGGSGNEKHEVFLEPTSEVGDNPFMTSKTVAATTPSTVASATTTPPTAKAATVAVSGATPGLYGGTLNVATCDSQQMIDFLQANPSKERAWAQAQGISPADVPDYIRGLTPVILRVDTRVINHGYSNGRATPHASILQAGTAVLVDNYGVPRARCYCGNPLTPPAPLSSPAYTGPRWQGFSPTTVIVVNQTTIVDNFTLIDVTTGESFTQPPGIDGVQRGKPTPSTWSITAKATGNNVSGSQDSVTTVEWNGTFDATDTISGTGQGTFTFDGGCYSKSTGERVSDWNEAGTFNVTVSGAPAGTGENRTFSLVFAPSGYSVTQADVPGTDAVSADCRRQAQDPSGFNSFLAAAFGNVQVPATDGDTTVTSGDFSVTVTLKKQS
jgi:hypothetical protein